MKLELARGFVKATLPLVVGGELVGVATAGARRAGDARKGPKGGSIGIDEAEGSAGQGPESRPSSPRRARAELAAQRFARLASLYAGLEAAARVNRTSLLWLALCGGALQRLMGVFSWNLALYLSLRSVAHELKRQKRAWHLHPLAIFASHCLHNGLLVNRAEWVEPTYIKLWLRTVPDCPSLAHWCADFDSAAAGEAMYRPSQCGEERLAAIPSKVWEGFQRQLPFVVALYAVPYLVAFRKTARAHFRPPGAALAFVRSLSLKVARTSLVLSVLPYTLTEFPCVYGFARSALLGHGTSPVLVPRAPVLHAALTATATTAAFLAEPESRLNMMVVYTYWRIVEAALRQLIKLKLKLRRRAPSPQIRQRQQARDVDAVLALDDGQDDDGARRRKREMEEKENEKENEKEKEEKKGKGAEDDIGPQPLLAAVLTGVAAALSVRSGLAV